MGEFEDDGLRWGVEIRRFIGGLIGLRDAKDPRKPYLVFTRSEWRSFVARVKSGEFDRIGE
ncbi:DUF397 domain-containing protein [Pseudonocardia sp. H11422]|uniref:DUF397 domain-containing protein n=1 Tax=Pseudonocardia sp. H11422 TaxID=2835866 RepID=UPI001BDC0B11|nr:DUF397 domain-containing protein [Pseudonocardia sp. H11422]